MAEKPPLASKRPAQQLLSLLKLPTGWADIHLAVAVSGGADSVALLLAIHQLKAQLGGAGRLMAMHVNHQLRGLESDEDARWLQQHCQRQQIPIEVLEADTAKYSAEQSCSLETAARQLRYQMLTDCAGRHGVRYLATAHTRDDQVETILFRTLRGTGLRGLAGIPAVRGLTESLTLVRPLLNCSRADVTAYLSARDQSYREDSSNTHRQFTRNRLRHDLLPALRDQYNSELDDALLRLATQADEGQAVIEGIAAKILQQANLKVQDNKLSVDCEVFRSSEPILVCEALRIAWREAHLPEQAMTYDWWRQLAGLALRSGSSSRLNLPGPVSATMHDDRLVLTW